MSGEKKEQPRPYTFPTVDLLDHGPIVNSAAEDARSRQVAAQLQGVLDAFRVDAKAKKFKNGAQMTRFLVAVGEKTKVNKVTGLKDNFSLKTGKKCDVSMEGGMIAIDVPNAQRRTLHIGDFKGYFRNRSCVVPLGDHTVMDITSLPHVLIAGASGSEKKVCVNAIITGLLFRCYPEAVKLVLIDSKKGELSLYHELPHLAAPIVSEGAEAAAYLESICRKMDKRYDAFAQAGVSSIEDYNDGSRSGFPAIVIVIDEFSDLMLTAKKDIEPPLVRLAQKGGPVGIYLIIATQRPSENVITDLIRTHIPARIAFKCLNASDSYTILDHAGAENLLGQGDMLYRSGDSADPIRLQGVFISDDEVDRVCDFIRKQGLQSTSTTTSSKSAEHAPKDWRQSEAYKKGWGIFAKFMQDYENRKWNGSED